MGLKLIREEDGGFLITEETNSLKIRIYPTISNAWYMQIFGKTYKLESAAEAYTIIMEVMQDCNKHIDNKE